MNPLLEVLSTNDARDMRLARPILSGQSRKARPLIALGPDRIYVSRETFLGNSKLAGDSAPALAAEERPNRSDLDAVPFRQARMGFFADRELIANCLDSFGCEDRRAASHAALSSRLLDVLLMGAQPEMGRVDTVAHIARVEDVKTGRDWAVVEFPGDAVSGLRAPRQSSVRENVDAKPSVTSCGELLPSPEPAAVGLGDHLPESFWIPVEKERVHA